MRDKFTEYSYLAHVELACVCILASVTDDRLCSMQMAEYRGEKKHEPLLAENKSRFTLFPIKYEKVRSSLSTSAHHLVLWSRY